MVELKMETLKVARCVQCGGQSLRDDTREDTLTVGTRTFSARLPMQVCTSCGEGYIPGPAIEAFENAVTRALVDAGASDGAAVRWLRKAAGLSAVALGTLLDVRPETVSRWENDANPVPRMAVYTLGTLALAAVHGQTSPVARLRVLAEPPPPPTEPVHLDVRAA
jgi:putative zinc finger/helix-turn-helix YgiT family protein